MVEVTSSKELIVKTIHANCTEVLKTSKQTPTPYILWEMPGMPDNLKDRLMNVQITLFIMDTEPALQLTLQNAL